MHCGWGVAVVLLAALGALPADGAPDAGTRCAAAKNAAVGHYTACRLAAVSHALAKGRSADFAPCTAQFARKWLKIEAKGGADCPTRDDRAAIQAAADACTIAVSAPLGPGTTTTTTLPDTHVFGRAVDYFTSAAVGSGTVSTDGLQQDMGSSTGPAGEYEFTVPVVATFTLIGGHTGYRLTRNPPVTTAGTLLSRDVQLVSTADAQRQYAGLGFTPVAGTAVVIADLQTAGGSPLTGVPLADVTLVDGDGVPVAGTRGPFFFGAAGDVVDAATLLVSTAFDARARVAFLDCPPGSYRLQVATVAEVALKCEANGATLATVRAAN